MVTIDNYLDSHYIHRSNWLRAAVLGANDGIISISSLAIGVAAASSSRDPILLATVAGLVAGALSMAAGEYVSVSSQTDIEHADIEREKIELAKMPEQELQILAEIYERRGLKKETALQVATIKGKNPPAVKAAPEAKAACIGLAWLISVMPSSSRTWAPSASDSVSSLALLMPVQWMEYILYGVTIIALVVLGAVSARAGGSGITKAVIRVVIWGSIAMGLSALVGYLFGVRV